MVQMFKEEDKANVEPGSVPLMSGQKPAGNTDKAQQTAATDKNKPTSVPIGDPEGGSVENEDKSDDGEARAAWGGKLEFIFTCIGYAVGLGNVWRFPYLCYKNGGGAFLVPYIIMLGLVGLPLFYMELALGQYANLGPIAIWKVNPLFKGLGYAMVSVSWLIAVYYNVIIAHTLLYLFSSFASIPTTLPWISCDNWWNTDQCIQPIYSTTDTNLTSNTTESVMATTQPTIVTTIASVATSIVSEVKSNAGHGNGTKTPAEEYYTNFILEQSSGIDEANGVNWKLALCLLLAWLIVLICLIKGIQSLGKVVYFTAIFPYIMLTILLIRGLSLPGASQGLIFYLKPDFSKLGEARVWSDAATQIFYSLGACTGGLIAVSSYNKFNNNCYRDSVLVACINCGTSIYAGLVIFSVLGFMAYEKGVDVADVAEGGPGLAFVVYPEAISRMPAPQLWAIFFFFMMATLGFGSQFSIVECVLSAFTDEYFSVLKGKWQSYAFRTTVILGTFLLGLPMVTRGGIYLLNLVDYSVSGFPLLVVGLLELIAVNWIYGLDRFSDDIIAMLGVYPNIYWCICWKLLTPAVIVITIVFNFAWYAPPTMDNYVYPPWAESLGWCIALFPILITPFYFIWKYCAVGGWDLMWEKMEPSPDYSHTERSIDGIIDYLDQPIPLSPGLEMHATSPGTPHLATRLLAVIVPGMRSRSGTPHGSPRGTPKHHRSANTLVAAVSSQTSPTEMHSFYRSDPALCLKMGSTRDIEGATNV